MDRPDLPIRIAALELAVGELVKAMASNGGGDALHQAAVGVAALRDRGITEEFRTAGGRALEYFANAGVTLP